MQNVEKSIRIPFETLKSEFIRVLLKSGFDARGAESCAEIFAINSRDGVNSHGLNRFPRFIKNVLEGHVKPHETPSLSQKSGSIEQWNGNLGPGPLNAIFATDRAIELSIENGMGMVTLANTNHWMRGGTYGWQAAKKGFVLICWTNTCQNMPAWGATDPHLGNNPLVIAVPYQNEAIVLDFAMSQYSYGKLDSLRKEGEKLPYPGGFDSKGELTSDPDEILQSWRVLPAGYWKGSGLSLMLDILATIFSGGLSTHQIESCDSEFSVSQVFIAINIRSLPNFPNIDSSIRKIIDDLHSSNPVDASSSIRYPGEKVLMTRKENEGNGVLVNKLAWERVQKM
jgi:3-dehydro-L-gulonate 2-dehydrogenase